VKEAALSVGRAWQWAKPLQRPEIQKIRAAAYRRPAKKHAEIEYHVWPAVAIGVDVSIPCR
jgi:hypothetical protein